MYSILYILFMTTVTFTPKSDELFRWINKENTKTCPDVIRRYTRDDDGSSQDVFYHIHSEIVKSAKFVEQQKRLKGTKFYNIETSKLDDGELPIPKTFKLSSIPIDIVEHMKTTAKAQINYKTVVSGKTFKVVFVVNAVDIYSQLGIYNKYFDRMVTWMHMANKYASDKCGNNLTVYLYFSPFEKSLPSEFHTVIGQDHANTAFTYSCPESPSEIVIYRQEEWFKVFIHETFHLLTLDFSGMNVDKLCSDKMSSVFSINSDFKIYETYTETWSVIINASLCAYYYLLENKTSFDEFLIAVNFFMGYEILFKVFQMNKILSFMDLSYEMLTGQDENIASSVKTLYKEDTNVFAYHIATTILLCNYKKFLTWCNTNSIASSPLVFKKTLSNVEGFCDFILEQHDSNITKKIVNNDCYLKMMKNIEDTNIWIRDTMRMTICEMA
jgi:hypothetical protein